MTPDGPKRVGLVESVGFALIGLLIWVNELLDVPHRVLGAPPLGSRLRWEEALLESGVVILVGILIVRLSVRAAARVAYLESLLLLCGWCRRVRTENGWISVERYLGEQGVEASHGICAECAAKMEQGGDAG